MATLSVFISAFVNHDSIKVEIPRTNDYVYSDNNVTANTTIYGMYTGLSAATFRENLFSKCFPDLLSLPPLCFVCVFLLFYVSPLCFVFFHYVFLFFSLCFMFLLLVLCFSSLLCLFLLSVLSVSPLCLWVCLPSAFVYASISFVYFSPLLLSPLFCLCLCSISLSTLVCLFR